MQKTVAQRCKIGGSRAVHEHTFNTQRSLDATSRADNRVLTDVEAVVGCPNVAELMLSVIPGDGINGKERVEDLRGKVGEEAGLGG